jgi:hypothetical protein
VIDNLKIFEHELSLSPWQRCGKRGERHFPLARKIFQDVAGTVNFWDFHIILFGRLPMSKAKEDAIMLISITVPETVIRAAQDRNLSIEEFVDTLIDKGMAKESGRPLVSSAIDRIRALHSDVVLPKH